MSSLVKDSLSPLLQSASTRRRSIELCQQIGSQLLSPTTITSLFSPTKKSPSSAKSDTSCATHSSNCSSKNASPFKTIGDAKALSPKHLFGSELFDRTTGAKPDANYHYKRRASDSLWIDTFPKLGGLVEDVERKRSLTPQFSDHSNFFNEKNKRTETESEDVFRAAPVTTSAKVSKIDSEEIIACNIIPPTPAKSVGKVVTRLNNVLHLDFPLKRLSSENESESEEERDVRDLRQKLRKREYSPQEETSLRKSAEKCDLDESLIQYALFQCNLVLNPGEVLGKGSFGTVVSGVHEGQEVAVKVLKITNIQKKASLRGEENALKLPFHNHVAKTIEIFHIEPDRALIVMEKMHKGSLLNLLNDPGFEVTCSIAITFAKQIALALMFCHRQGLLHLDVKPQNILVDLKNCCKLSDFGSSKMMRDLSDSYKYYKIEGTVPYTAPELFRGSKPTEKCDVYSFAITMWQILTRELPYEEENEHAVIFRVVSQGLRPKQTPDANNNCGSTFTNERERMLVKNYSDLYIKAWHSNPDERPNMTDIHKRLIEIQLLEPLT